MKIIKLLSFLLIISLGLNAQTNPYTVGATGKNVQYLGHPIFVLGSDASSDMWYRNSLGVMTRIPIGTTNQALSVVGGLPTWRTIPFDSVGLVAWNTLHPSYIALEASSPLKGGLIGDTLKVVADSGYWVSDVTIVSGNLYKKFRGVTTLVGAIGGGGGTYTAGTGLSGTSTFTVNLSTGIAGGQTLVSGVNASDPLTISSTSNATKGVVNIDGELYVDKTNGAVGIGTSSFPGGYALYTGGMRSTSKVTILTGPTAFNGTGSLNIGGGGAFNSGSGTDFQGSSSGTTLAINEIGTYTGDFINFELNGSSKFKVDYQGKVTSIGIITGSILLGATTITSTGVQINYLNIASGTTGTGSLVYATSPTLITPNLGTPSAAVLTNATGLSLTSGVTGILPIANGGTNANTANAGLNNLLPSQTGNGTKFLQTDGTNTSWATVSSVTPNGLTMNSSGTGDASGTSFNGSAARTISYNTIGAQAALVSGTNIKTVGSTSLLGSGDIPFPVTSVFGRTGAVTATSGDYSVSQITGAAPINNATLTGIPNVPTAALGTNTTQAASTAFVYAATGGHLVNTYTTVTSGTTPVTLFTISVASGNVAEQYEFDVIGVDVASGFNVVTQTFHQAFSYDGSASTATVATVDSKYQGSFSTATLFVGTIATNSYPFKVTGETGKTISWAVTVRKLVAVGSAL